MKIISDPGNINALKLLIGAAQTKTNVEIQRSECGGTRLPRLLLNEEGSTLFSSNTALLYLWSAGSDMLDSDVIVEQWLEWESTQLQPAVHALCLGPTQNHKRSPSLLARLIRLLTQLNTTCQNNPVSLTGVSLSVADVAVWCSVLPLICKNSPFTDMLSQFPHLQKWYENISQAPSVVSVVQRLPGGATWEAIKTSLLTSVPVPLDSAAPCERGKQTDTTQTASSSKLVENLVTLPSVTPQEVKVAEEAWQNGKVKVAPPRQRKIPVLPQEGERNVMITSALPYVNNVPHLGNIIGCVLSADVFSRFCQLRNVNVLYISGTDEYGTATETKAVEEGITPQEICDKYNKLHTEIYEWFNIGFDYFGRTTTQQQTEVAQDIFWKLHQRGFILQDTLDQLLCEKCSRFLADRFVEGTCPFCAYEDARGDQCDKCGKLINAVDLIQPRCKQCQSTPVVRNSKHLFMDLPKLQPLLEAHLDQNLDSGHWTSNAKVITRSWIRDGLKPRCISRDLKWGTPVPLEGYTDKVFYVWYDAPIGYISITANYTDQWERWWKNPQKVELYNFMAKDNVPFHSVIFPSSLLGTGDNWTVVNHLSATEYLNYEDGKFSKSRNVGVFGNDAQDTGIPADVWRFYLLYMRPESQDSTFCWDDFVLKNNSELLNNLGNFINRALMFVSNSFGGVIPQMLLVEEDKELLALVTRELQSFITNLTNVKIRDGIRNILTISRYGNQYIQANKPWVKVKGSAEEKVRAGTIVGVAANISCLLSVMVQPYMPEVSRTIQTQLNAPATCNVLSEMFVPHLEPGHHIGKPSPLFQKLEISLVEELRQRFAGKRGAKPSADDSTGAAASPEEIERLTKAMADQGTKVRQLKTEKAEKSKIDEQVAILLKIKKDLASAQGQSPSGGGSSKKNSKQQPKQSKAPGNAAVPKAAPTPSANPEAVTRLTKEVADQGEVVRKVKSEKAEKSKIDQAIGQLLDLKRQLATAQGIDPDTLIGGGKKKNKKK